MLALQDADVELFSLLIDEGDITHPSNAERDMAWIEDGLTLLENSVQSVHA